MLRFPFKRPLKSFTTQSADRLTKLVLPRWYFRVELGEHSYMNDEAEVHAFRTPQTLRVGRYSSIGRCTFVVDGDHDTSLASLYPFRELGASPAAPESTGHKPLRPPTVGNDCWICDGAVLIGGVAVGDGAVVAGHAVVTRDVPPYAVVAGNPARVVKHRFGPETVEAMLRARWWDLDHRFVCERLAPVTDDVDEFLRRAQRQREAGA